MNELAINRKMEVVHLVGNMALGGASKLVKFNVENTNCDEYNVGVCCLGSLGEYGQELIEKGYSVEVFGLSRSLRDVLKNIFAIINLFLFLKRKKIDILNVHLFISGTIGRVFGRLLKIPCVIHTTHNIMYPRVEPIINRLLEKYTDAIVVDSNAVKNKLINAGQKAQKISVIYNGIDEKEFDQSCNSLITRQKFDIPPGDIVIGNIAGFQYYKGHDFLLDVFEKLHVGKKRIHLMLIGDGELRQQLELKVENLDIQDRVHFLGMREDISSLIKTMDIMFHPSRWEGFGIVLAEAMYCGIPVVASDRGGIPEVVKHEVCGFIHPFGDINAFVKSISLLINDEPLRLRFSINGRVRVKEKFTMKKMTENYSEIYKAILRGKGYSI
jgi:glycosyltransferase involved in cell wall biosynthesis